MFVRRCIRTIQSGATANDQIVSALTTLANAIVSASPNWSITFAPGAIVANKYITLLTHADGAQFVLGCSSSGNLANAGNEYQLTSYRLLFGAFKPSISAGSLSVNPGANDPWTTAAWCDTAGAYRFVSVQTYGYFYAGNSVYNILCDNTRANMIITVSAQQESNLTNNVIVIADNHASAMNFSHLFSAGDTETSFFAMFYGSAAGSMLPSSTANRYIQFKTSAGVRLQDGRFTYSKDSLDNKYQITPGLDVESMALVTTTPTIKGRIDKRLLGAVKPTARWGRIFNDTTNPRIHIKDGLCTAWGPLDESNPTELTSLF